MCKDDIKYFLCYRDFTIFCPITCPHFPLYTQMLCTLVFKCFPRYPHVSIVKYGSVHTCHLVIMLSV